MSRWLHIEDENDAFFRIDCTKVTYVYYNGFKSLAIFTVNNHIVFEFSSEDGDCYTTCKEYAKEISDFIEGGDEDGNIMLVSVAGKKNTIKVTKRDSKHNSINID